MAKDKNIKCTSKTQKEGFVEKSYTPDELYQKFLDYTTWCDNNPIPDERVSKGEILVINLRRPYTLVGFCVFADINRQTFEYHEKNNPVFLQVCARIRACVEGQQIEGASIGQFNASIIARLQNLREHTDITTNGEALSSNQPQTTFNVVVDKDAADIITSFGRCSITNREEPKE